MRHRQKAGRTGPGAPRCRRRLVAPCCPQVVDEPVGLVKDLLLEQLLDHVLERDDAYGLGVLQGLELTGHRLRLDAKLEFPWGRRRLPSAGAPLVALVLGLLGGLEERRLHGERRSVLRSRWEHPPSTSRPHGSRRGKGRTRSRAVRPCQRRFLQW